MSNDNTAKPTAGPWEMWTGCSWRRIGSASGAMVCEPVVHSDGHPDLFFPNGGFEGPDARLMLEAGTVYHETGLTPRQLAEQRDELLESAKFLLSLQQLRSRKTDEIRAIIAKVEAKL